MRIDKFLISRCSLAVLSVFVFPALVYTSPANKKYNDLSESQLTAHLRDLRNLKEYERRTFFNSFDTVITDIDDILRRNGLPIDGAIESIKRLRDCGKKIVFLTNNSAHPKEKFAEILRGLTYNVSLSEIINPSDTLIWYLKHLKLNGTVFVIGTTNFVNTLKKNDIQVLTGPRELTKVPKQVIKTLTNLNKAVKAVVFELDINVNYAKIMQAAGYLKRNDVMFLTGTLDRKISMTEKLAFIGTAPFVDILTEYSGKTPMGYAKPSLILKDYLRHVHVTNDPKRTLFIGNSLQTDMQFAQLCGFQKLWVQSGVDGTNSCKKGCEGSPNYFLPNLREMPQCKSLDS